MKTTQYQPKTGQACGCKRGVQRDNCPQCEGTGQRIDFSAIRARKFCADSNVPTVPACPAGEHTPGPWTVGLDYDGAPLIVEYQCRDICRVDARDGVSNARLIASAPALAAALRELYPVASRALAGTSDGEPRLERARAALALAEGGGL